MVTSDPRRTPDEAPTSIFGIFAISAAIIALFVGAAWFGAHSMAETTRKATQAMPDYRYCRDLAAEIGALAEEARFLDVQLNVTGNDRDWARYEEVRKRHDQIAKRHNQLLIEYDEVMLRHDMRFSVEELLPPDAHEPLPYAFYPIFRYGSD